METKYSTQRTDANNCNFMFVEVKREPSEIFSLTEAPQFHCVPTKCSNIETEYKRELLGLENVNVVKKENEADNFASTENLDNDYVATKVRNCIDRNFKSNITTQMNHNEKDYRITLTERRTSKPRRKPICSSKLKKHIYARDLVRSHTCEICEKVFTVRSNMLKHVRSHTEERNYKCEICTKLFKSNDNMSRHMKRHTEESNYTCDICSKSFKMRQYMLEHSKSHNEERNYKCEICTMSFKTNQVMSRHMKTHLIAKQKCAICSKSLKSRSMSRHMKLHTKDDSNEDFSQNIGQIRKDDRLQEKSNKSYKEGLKEEMETNHMFDTMNASRTTSKHHTDSSRIKVKVETEIVYLPQIIECAVKNEKLPSNNFYN